MKLSIEKVADIQTAFRLPEAHWDKIKKLAKENKCSNSDVLRYIIARFIEENNDKLT